MAQNNLGQSNCGIFKLNISRAKWWKRAQNGHKIGFFGLFEKFCCVSFSGNSLIWKLILLLIIHHLIWQNSGSRVMDQNAASQSNCRIL